MRRNITTDAQATARCFGCRGAARCQISSLIVEGNFINDVDGADPESGYGIQLKVKTNGVITDNVIGDTKGPGIMVYGSSDQTRPSLIERNFVTGSRQSAGVLIGGGPAQVRSDIVGDNVRGGITLQDYADPGGAA